jgi:hypothetical protein
MEAYCRNLLDILGKPINEDPITKCGKENIELLVINPDAALKLANEKLHVFPFKDVESCWRRLYTDAGVRKAISQTLNHLEESNLSWLDEVVKQIDMVLIMTGAPLREKMVEDFLRELQALEKVPSLKKKKTEFDTFDYRAPEISFPIPKSEMSLSQFEKHLNAPIPHVIKGSLYHWPAFDERPWKSPSYLKEKTFNGRRLVPVELGRSYTDEGWGQAIITFSDFLDQYVLNPGENLGYLAQHDLFAQIPSLRNDISIPDFCYTSPPGPVKESSLYGKAIQQLEEPLLNAWFGPAGTVSPLHTDPYHNILCQVVGKKYIRLYAPDQTKRLYPRGMEDGIDMSNTSNVPIEKVEMNLGTADDFPLFDEAPYMETILGEGECLYIPVGWWHYVRSLTVSFSVSFWWN